MCFEVLISILFQGKLTLYEYYTGKCNKPVYPYKNIGKPDL